MKKNFVLILTLLFLTSCDQNTYDPENDLSTLNLEKTTNLDYVWVCNHPQTKFHNRVCVEDTYPAGCFVSGDPSKFCWILTISDCQEELLYDWQINNCHLLKGD